MMCIFLLEASFAVMMVVNNKGHPHVSMCEHRCACDSYVCESMFMCVSNMRRHSMRIRRYAYVCVSMRPSMNVYICMRIHCIDMRMCAHMRMHAKARM